MRRSLSESRAWSSSLWRSTSRGGSWSAWARHPPRCMESWRALDNRAYVKQGPENRVLERKRGCSPRGVMSSRASDRLTREAPERCRRTLAVVAQPGEGVGDIAHVLDRQIAALDAVPPASSGRGLRAQPRGYHHPRERLRQAPGAPQPARLVWQLQRRRARSDRSAAVAPDRREGLAPARRSEESPADSPAQHGRSALETHAHHAGGLSGGGHEPVRDGV